MMAAIAEDATSQGLDVEFRAPDEVSVRNYLSRMNLRECLGQFCDDVDLQKVRHRDLGDRVIELQRFEDSDASEAVADRIFGAAIKAGHSEADASSLFRGISEVLNNVVEHSRANGGWTALQLIPNSDGRITFAVSDAGIGLQDAIGRGSTVRGPRDAMEKAFRRGVSGTGDSGRGNGLSNLLQRVGSHRGKIRAWSGVAEGYGDKSPIRCSSAAADVPGTLIYAGFTPEKRRC